MPVDVTREHCEKAQIKNTDACAAAAEKGFIRRYH
jgi:hypothetical protein